MRNALPSVQWQRQIEGEKSEEEGIVAVVYRCRYDRLGISRGNTTRNENGRERGETIDATSTANKGARGEGTGSEREEEGGKTGKTLYGCTRAK